VETLTEKTAGEACAASVRKVPKLRGSPAREPSERPSLQSTFDSAATTEKQAAREMPTAARRSREERSRRSMKASWA
jgi:hypothetical protein